MIKFISKINSLSKKNSYSFSISLGSYLKSHNLIYQSTDSHLFSDQSSLEILSKSHPNFPYFSAYCGFDPTSSALHLGNFISILTLIRLSFFGIKPIFLIGGATGMIGDPSGKSLERKLLAKEEIQENLDGINNTIKKVVDNIYGYLKTEEGLDFGGNVLPLGDCKYSIENNHKFYEKMNVIEFIRDFGKHFKMQVLLNKETVASRLNNEEGISFAEFAYQLLQAYDFYQLFQEKNCVLQIGGSDQWGNITNGCDLIKKILKKEVFGLTTPLLVTSTGKKFGKSEGNAIWLTSERTNQYDMFQYFMNINDSDIEKYLKMFSFHDLEKITEIMRRHFETPEKRIAQTFLGETIMKMLYFEENKKKTENSSKNTAQKFFETDFTTFKTKNVEEIIDFFKDLNPIYPINLSQNPINNLMDLIIFHKIKKTKTEIRRNIEMGGVYLNDQRINMEMANTFEFIKENLLANKFLVLRFGKKNYYLLEFL